MPSITNIPTSAIEQRFGTGPEEELQDPVLSIYDPRKTGEQTEERSEDLSRGMEQEFTASGLANTPWDSIGKWIKYCSPQHNSSEGLTGETSESFNDLDEASADTGLFDGLLSVSEAEEDRKTREAELIERVKNPRRSYRRLGEALAPQPGITRFAQRRPQETHEPSSPVIPEDVVFSPNSKFCQ